MEDTTTIVHPLELRREALLDRFTASRPKIVALVAPAGFGKTTFARQLVGAATSAAICDGAGVRDDLDLARRLIAALAEQNSEFAEQLYQQELLLADGGASVAERLNVALSVWRETPCSQFVFENAENIVACASAREFFGRLLGERPDGRTVVICSREGLRFHLTRYADPHEIMMIRGRDLAFDAADVRSIFGRVSDEFVERILTVSQGWPIAVLLLHRFSAEGRITKLLDRVDDIAFEQLHDYLADEVLSTVEPRVVDALFAIAAIPDATAVDLRLATSDSRIVTDLTDLARESAFVSRVPDGSFHVHPLLASLLLENEEEKRATLLQTIASGYEGQRHFIRAAQMYQALGDERRSAQALARYEPFDEHLIPMAYASVLSSLDRSIVLLFPRLWGMTAMLRSFYVDFAELLDEADSLWRTLPPDTSKGQRTYVFLCRILFMGYVGKYDEALELLVEYMRSIDVSVKPTSPFESYLYYVRAVLLGRTGRFTEAESDLTLALPLVDAMDLVAAASFSLLGGDLARARGERAVERQLLERALDRARLARMPNITANILAECTISAWLDGDEELFTLQAAELEQIVERFGVKAFALLAAAARGRVVAREPADLNRAVAFGRLMAITRAANDHHAVRLAHEALVAAEEAHQPFLEALACAAIALNADDEFDAMIARARVAAARCEAPNLHAAIEAIAQRRVDCGCLTAFVTNVSRTRANRTAPVEIGVVSGNVRVDGKVLSLSTRELELIIALALKREPTSRARLASILWPDAEESSARNALSVSLHRLRAHLGRDDVVIRDGDGYRLNPNATVDIWEIERAVSTIRTRDRLSESDCESLRRVWERLRAERPARMHQWEWFAPTERRLGEFRMEVGHRLALDALARAVAHEALAYAEDMIAYDPCDEPARDVAIRAHLSVGDRAAAFRQYRQYRETLLSELQCEPSTALRTLVGA